MPAPVAAYRGKNQGGAAAFTPLSLSPSVWLKADASDNTLNTDQIAGVGSVSAVGGTTVTGVGTSFLSVAVAGDTFQSDDVSIDGAVASVTDNTHLEMTEAQTGTGVSYTVTPTAGLTDRLAQLTDQSGNGNHATRATASARPAKIPNAQNGLAGMLSDGVNDDLICTSAITSKPVSIFVVLKPSNVSSNRHFIGSDTINGLTLRITPAGLLQLTQMDTSDIASSSDALSNNTTVIVAATYSALGAYAFYKNAAASGTGTNNVTIAAAKPYIASRDSSLQFFAGRLFEIVIFPSVLSAGNIANMFTYLNGRYAAY